MLKTFLVLLFLAPFSCAALRAQQAPSTPPASQFSGVYSFLREGEIIQLEVDDEGNVTGLISRFGESESDRGALLEQLFEKAVLKGNQVTFSTRKVHGIRYDFEGKIERGPGQDSKAEGYWVIRGHLRRVTTDAENQESSSSREVEFKSLPVDLGDEQRTAKP